MFVEIILTSIIAGVFTAILLNSYPYQSLVKSLRLSISNPVNKLINCAMCSGYWITAGILLYNGFNALNVILYAALGSLTAELIDRKLWSEN
jgi:hypothetical protein